MTRSCFIASIVLSREALAVIMMNSIDVELLAKSATRFVPEMSGNPRSTRAISYLLFCDILIASLPLPAVLTANPLSAKTSSRLSLNSSLSSTIRILSFVFIGYMFLVSNLSE